MNSLSTHTVTQTNSRSTYTRLTRTYTQLTHNSHTIHTQLTHNSHATHAQLTGTSHTIYTQLTLDSQAINTQLTLHSHTIDTQLTQFTRNSRGIRAKFARNSHATHAQLTHYSHTTHAELTGNSRVTHTRFARNSHSISTQLTSNPQSTLMLNWNDARSPIYPCIFALMSSIPSTRRPLANLPLHIRAHVTYPLYSKLIMPKRNKQVNWTPCFELLSVLSSASPTHHSLFSHADPPIRNDSHVHSPSLTNTRYPPTSAHTLTNHPNTYTHTRARTLFQRGRSGSSEATDPPRWLPHYCWKVDAFGGKINSIRSSWQLAREHLETHATFGYCSWSLILSMIFNDHQVAQR